MGTLSDAWYAFLKASLGGNPGTTSDLQNQFATKYANGLDSYMTSLVGGTLGRKFVSGFYYTTDGSQGDSTVAITADNGYLRPFTVGNTTSFDQISCEVTAAGAGSTIDLVVYSPIGAGGVITRLANITGLSGAAVAVVTGALAPLVLSPGVYWIGAIVHGATLPTLRSRPPADYATLGYPNGGSANPSSILMAAAAGAAPASLTLAVGNIAQSGNIPKVMLRAA